MNVQANEAEYFGLCGLGQRIESCCRVTPFPAAAGRAGLGHEQLEAHTENM